MCVCVFGLGIITIINVYMSMKYICTMMIMIIKEQSKSSLTDNLSVTYRIH